MKIKNTFIIFLVSGFWHGANLTFIIWGGLNALFIMPSIIFNTHRDNLDIVAKGKYLPSIKDVLSIVSTFGLTVFAWIFFRAESVQQAVAYISTIASFSIFTIPHFNGIERSLPIVALTIIFMSIEWIGREQPYAIAQLGLTWCRAVRWLMYYCIIFAICYYAVKEQQFIYFQF